jgi:hypothetical protein
LPLTNYLLPGRYNPGGSATFDGEIVEMLRFDVLEVLNVALLLVAATTIILAAVFIYFSA